jgi:hypothetical protein
MADNYLQSSFCIDDVSESEISWLKSMFDFMDRLSQQETHELSDGEKAILRDTMGWGGGELPETYWGWELEIIKNEWAALYAEEFGDVEMMTELMQRFLQKFRPKKYVVLTWAETCSKPRPDEFGGGAMLVTSKEVRRMNAHRWADEEMEKLQQELNLDSIRTGRVPVTNNEKEYVPTICVDFDGVLHSYTSGWKGADTITDPPVEGAIEWLTHAAIQDGVQIAIYSSRSKDPSGVDAMKWWLGEHIDAFLTKYSMGIPVEDVVGRLDFPTEKPAAIMTIDDRAHCFTGKFRSLNWYLNFKPWNKRSPETHAAEYPKDWNDDDEDLAEQTLECLLDCLLTDRDGFYMFEPSAFQYLATTFAEAKKNASTPHTKSRPIPSEGVLREIFDEVLSNEACASKCLDNDEDRAVVREELIRAMYR